MEPLELTVTRSTWLARIFSKSSNNWRKNIRIGL